MHFSSMTFITPWKQSFKKQNRPECLV